MSDVITRPVDNTPKPEPTIPSEMQSREQWAKASGNEREPTGPDALDEQSFSGDERGLRSATRALKRAREAAAGNVDMTEDGYNRKHPTVVRAYPSSDDNPKTLREANEDIGFTRKLERLAPHLRPDTPPETAYELGKQVGAEPVTPPPKPVWMLDDKGNVIERLRDHEAVRPADGLNLEDATRLLGNAREAEAWQREQLARELQGQAEQARQQAIAAQQAVEQPTQPGTQPPQPTLDIPTAATHAEAARARAIESQVVVAAARVQQLAAEEQALVRQHEQVDQWVRQNGIPTDEAGVKHLARTNPELARRLQPTMQEYERRLQRWDQIQQEKVRLAPALAPLAAAQQQQQWHQYITTENAKADQWLAQHYPKYSSGEPRARMQAEVQRMVREDMRYGQALSLPLSDPRRINLERELRSFPVQQHMGELAIRRDMEKQARATLHQHRRQLPPVQRPGNLNSPRGGGDTESTVHAIERQMDGARTQREYLNLARRLTQAKRAAGQL